MYQVLKKHGVLITRIVNHTLLGSKLIHVSTWTLQFESVPSKLNQKVNRRFFFLSSRTATGSPWMADSRVLVFPTSNGAGSFTQCQFDLQDRRWESGAAPTPRPFPGLLSELLCRPWHFIWSWILCPDQNRPLPGVSRLSCFEHFNALVKVLPVSSNWFIRWLLLTYSSMI